MAKKMINTIWDIKVKFMGQEIKITDFELILNIDDSINELVIKEDLFSIINNYVIDKTENDLIFYENLRRTSKGYYEMFNTTKSNDDSISEDENITAKNNDVISNVILEQYVEDASTTKNKYPLVLPSETGKQSETSYALPVAKVAFILALIAFILSLIQLKLRLQ